MAAPTTGSHFLAVSRDCWGRASAHQGDSSERENELPRSLRFLKILQDVVDPREWLEVGGHVHDMMTAELVADEAMVQRVACALHAVEENAVQCAAGTSGATLPDYVTAENLMKLKTAIAIEEESVLLDDVNATLHELLCKMQDEKAALQKEHDAMKLKQQEQPLDVQP